MTLPVFRDPSIEEPAYFDESGATPFTHSSTSLVNSGSVTIDIDGLRQGVEITQQKYWDAGLVKIWSGEPGHAKLDADFGIGNAALKTGPFSDAWAPRARVIQSIVNVDSGDPVVLITSNPHVNANVGNDVFILSLDGVLEPLSIRDVAAFSSIDTPFEAHSVVGAVGNGNIDQFRASDNVETVFVVNTPHSIPYLDNGFSAYQSISSTLVNQGHTIGYFFFEQSVVTPFDDKKNPDKTLISLRNDSVISNALSSLGGDTDNYVSGKQRANSSGFMYESGVGTDSLSFGITVSAGAYVHDKLAYSGSSPAYDYKTFTLNYAGSNPFNDNATCTFTGIDNTTSSLINGALAQMNAAKTHSGVQLSVQDAVNYEIFKVPASSPVDPFVEESLFEQGQDNSFYSGSSVDLFGTALKQPLRDKVQIRLSLPVSTNTQMIPLTSSIYYYNKSSKSFVNVAANNLCAPSKAILSGGYPPDGGPYKLVDFRGFDAVGTPVSSGTNSPPGQPTVDNNIVLYNFSTFNSQISNVFTKNIETNQDYQATNNETFSIPITQPFVIEKVVFELPFAAGHSWFADKTTSFSPLEYTTGVRNNFNSFGGPCVTIALFNKLQTGTSSRMDLITSGTITHTFDNVSEIVLSRDNADPDDFSLRSQGFLSYTSAPSAVVTPNAINTSFTGSVIVPTMAAVSNGITVGFRNPGGTVAFRNLFASKNITTLNAYVINANPFGRDLSGFGASGRSVFGKTYCVKDDAVLANPYYFTGSLPSDIEAAVTSVSASIYMNQTLILNKNVASPYIVFPGDRFVLSVSKVHPFYFGNGLMSGSATHDVQIIAGTLNLTFYGSYLQGNNEIV